MFTGVHEDACGSGVAKVPGVFAALSGECLRLLGNHLSSRAVGLLECAARIRGSHLYGSRLRPRDLLVLRATDARIGARGLRCGVCGHFGDVQVRSFTILLRAPHSDKVMVEAVGSEHHLERDEEDASSDGDGLRTHPTLGVV